MSEFTGPQRSILGRFADRLRFGLERMVLRGLGYRLLLAAGIVTTVALVGGLLAFWLAGGFAAPGDAVWWSFLRLTDPGYLGDDEGTALRAISTVVTVLGYVLFLGLLIAILTQWLNQTIQRLESGLTPIALSDHVIVLGWTDRTPAIVAGLLGARGRIHRFLAERGARELRVVILADGADAALRQELRERLGELWDDRRVLLRCGSPLRLDHLERVAFRSAGALVLPGADFAERNPEAADAGVVKTLLSISKNAGAAAPPQAVAEVFDARQDAIARRAYSGPVEILAADRMVSRMIAQAVCQRGLHRVYEEIFTLGMGNAIYLRPLPELAASPFGSLRARFPGAVPIGLVRGDGATRLHPDPATRVEAEDAIVLLAPSYDACTPVPAGEADGDDPPPSRCRPDVDGTRRALILGWSRKVPALLQELLAYGADAFEIDVLSMTPVAHREEQLERFATTGAPTRVRHHEGGFIYPGALEELEPAGYDEIVLVASEMVSQEDEADANTVLGYLHLSSLLPAGPDGPEILVELLREENRALFPAEHVRVIVSSSFMSYAISQVALRPELASVFDLLTRPRGPQIVLTPLAEVLPDAARVCFHDLQCAAAERGEIALGLQRGGPDGLALNPARDAEWSVAASDQLVSLTSYAEGPARRS